VDAIRSNGFSLDQLEEPSTDLEINTELFDDLNKALVELYDLKVDKALLDLY